MNEVSHAVGYRTYWATWLALLALTLAMMALGAAAWPKPVMLGFLLTGMLLKAGLIGAYFMHLRFERLALVATVVISFVFTVASLFLLILVDGRWINALAPR